MDVPYYYQTDPFLRFADITDGRLASAGVHFRELHPLIREKLLKFENESILVSFHPLRGCVYFAREKQQPAPEKLLKLIADILEVEVFDENDARIWCGMGSLEGLTEYCHDVQKDLAYLHQQDVRHALAKVRGHYSRQPSAPGQELPLPPLSDMEWDVLETNPDELLEFFWHIARAEADRKRRGKAGCIIGDPPGLLTIDDLFS